MYKNTARPTVRRTVAGDRCGLRVIAEARRSRIGQHQNRSACRNRLPLTGKIVKPAARAVIEACGLFAAA